MLTFDLGSQDWIQDAADRIKKNEIGLIPFDTVWGLVGRITPAVIQRMFDIKRRPIDRPLLVVIGHEDHLTTLCPSLTSGQRQQIQIHWPGPVTLVLPKLATLPSILTGSAEGVAIRFSAAPWVTDLINAVGEPLISTSANRHGDPVPSTPNEWDSRIVDSCDFTVPVTLPMTGTPSMIIDCLGLNPRIIRTDS